MAEATPATDPYEVDLNVCRGRQRRLLAELQRQQLEGILLTKRESVQWLSGAQIGPPFAPAAWMDDQGRVVVVLPSRKAALPVAADEVHPYAEKWLSTLRDVQRSANNEVLLKLLPNKLRRVGAEWSEFGPELSSISAEIPLNVEPFLFQLRRRKDADELRMLRRANDANRQMYAVAREIVAPGRNELEIYSALQGAAVSELGEALTYFGQDFRANARGGLPRNRRIEAGELYILDLGVGFRGYYSDNSRTLAVGGNPTPQQQAAWQIVRDVFTHIEAAVRPGKSCRELYAEVNTLLNQHSPWVFNHHLGHGVGLAPHEAPHLNPHWDDVFEEGDFFAAEPALYHDELRHGVRLEENYLVTATGVEKVTDFPLEL